MKAVAVGIMRKGLILDKLVEREDSKLLGLFRLRQLERRSSWHSLNWEI